jgi:quercetin dioxygenase-like cupin family protein
LSEAKSGVRLLRSSSRISLALNPGYGGQDMQPVKDASSLYEVERRAYHAARPGFRIAELQISPTQKVPWHYHNNVHDTFYVLEGTIRIFLQQPKEDIRLTRGETFSVPPKRPHLVTNAGDTSAVFLVLQGLGEYDFVPLTSR